MIMRWQLVMVMMLVLSVAVRAESFVVNKKKPQKQSMSKLKEQYGNELAELIRMIPGLQKQLAELQERLINELYTLLNDDLQVGKVELDLRLCQAQELRSFLEDEVSCPLPAKAAFIKQAAPKASTNKL